MDDNIFDEIRRAADSGDRRVRVDLSGVDFLSREMIDKLVRANRQAKEADVDIVIVNASPNVREVFKITRLNRVFTIESE